MSPHGLAVREWILYTNYDHEGLLALDSWRHQHALLDEIRMALA